MLAGAYLAVARATAHDREALPVSNESSHSLTVKARPHQCQPCPTAPPTTADATTASRPESRSTSTSSATPTPPNSSTPGVSIEAVRRRLGHASTETTQIYALLADEHVLSNFCAVHVRDLKLTWPSLCIPGH
jgi:hypothetical protein